MKSPDTGRVIKVDESQVERMLAAGFVMVKPGEPITENPYSGRQDAEGKRLAALYDAPDTKRRVLTNTLLNELGFGIPQAVGLQDEDLAEVAEQDKFNTERRLGTGLGLLGSIAGGGLVAKGVAKAVLPRLLAAETAAISPEVGRGAGRVAAELLAQGEATQKARRIGNAVSLGAGSAAPFVDGEITPEDAVRTGGMIALNALLGGRNLIPRDAVESAMGRVRPIREGLTGKAREYYDELERLNDRAASRTVPLQSAPTPRDAAGKSSKKPAPAPKPAEPDAFNLLPLAEQNKLKGVINRQVDELRGGIPVPRAQVVKEGITPQAANLTPRELEGLLRQVPKGARGRVEPPVAPDVAPTTKEADAIVKRLLGELEARKPKRGFREE